MADEPHAAVLLALLEAIPQPVYDGEVPSGATRPYVLVYITVQTSDTSTFTAASDITTVTLYAHCVGDTAAAARLVQAAVRSALLNITPTISGRTCGQISEDEALSPDTDETTGVSVMDAISIYSLTTWPG
jgi:hypothetical protein